MPQIVVDAELSNKLHDASGMVDLCDPSGKVLGRFTPVVDMSEWEPISPEASEEELDRREMSNEWYSFDQVIGHLRDLEKN